MPLEFFEEPPPTAEETARREAEAKAAEAQAKADEWINATLCRWAEAKYGLADVTRVLFDHGQKGPYSDVTPDIDAYVEVRVWTAERERERDEQQARRHTLPRGPERWVGPHEFEESYSGGLIREILAFVAP